MGGPLDWNPPGVRAPPWRGTQAILAPPLGGALRTRPPQKAPNVSFGPFGPEFIFPERPFTVARLPAAQHPQISALFMSWGPPLTRQSFLYHEGAFVSVHVIGKPGVVALFGYTLLYVVVAQTQSFPGTW